ncbi:hypothetical protein B0H14DRAFT_2575977 [Mycena olivaceomarginata]|nr:hypothetical protein B0H14DRAFT_2575977 [Mycena olivaceomarginata]
MDGTASAIGLVQCVWWLNRTGRIYTNRPGNSGCDNNCFGGGDFYDISNIQGFSIAYRSDPRTCGGTDPDEATHVGASSDYTVVVAMATAKEYNILALAYSDEHERLMVFMPMRAYTEK